MQRTSLRVLTILCVAVFVSAQSRRFRCDYTQFQDVGWMKVHLIPSNWHDAQLRCRLEGATLASPLNEELKEAMLSLMALRRISKIYTGVSARFSKGDFYSIEGVPLSKIKHTWVDGNPNNGLDDESCILITNQGQLEDFTCNSPYPYICYKKKDGLVMTQCGTTDAQYTFDARTGHCYKFHKVPRIWSRAFMACSAEGAYLTIINSESEAAIIKELWEKNPADSMLGSFWKDVAHIGFHDWGERGDMVTIHGQPLAETGYTTFAPGEPNNATTGEFCGGVYRSGMLDDIWCDNPYAFICEKDPDSLLCDD